MSSKEQNMKYPKILALAFFASCAGTDVVEDRLTSLEILVPSEVTSVNGSFAKLIGESAQLEVTAKSDLGGSFFYGEATWSSSNTAVASIDENGLITAISQGNALITASALGITSDPIAVAVTPDNETIALIEITSEGGVAILDVGGTLQLEANALNILGGSISDATISWESDNENVATVDANGFVTGISDGAVQITATSGDAVGFFDLLIGSQESLSRSGEFRGLNGYDASGTVTLSTNDNGSLQVALNEAFRTQNGPGLYLYLSNSATRVAGGVELGALRSTRGADTYPVPGDVEITDFDHIVLYCKPFGVGFGTAELSN